MEQNFRYKKIVILGGPGSGKSTLANRMGLFTKYPIYHLDDILLDLNWEKKDENNWENRINQILSLDCGIIEGHYPKNLNKRVEWADLIIFIDVSNFIHILRFTKRYFKIRLKVENSCGWPQKAKEKFSLRIMGWVCFWNKKYRGEIVSILKLFKDKKIVIIKEPRKLDLEELLNS